MAISNGESNKIIRVRVVLVLIWIKESKTAKKRIGKGTFQVSSSKEHFENRKY